MSPLSSPKPLKSPTSPRSPVRMDSEKKVAGLADSDEDVEFARDPLHSKFLGAQSADLGILRCICGSVATVVMTFFITLTVFPGLIAEIRPASNPEGVPFPEAGRVFGDLWVPLLFLTFNIGDTVGRVASSKLAAWPVLTGSLAIGRAGFIPLLIAIRGPPSLEVSHIWARCYDAGAVVIVALMAMSNGAIGGSAMIHGPSRVHKDCSSRAGTIMAFFLQTGLLLGSVNSFVVRAWL